MTGTIAILAFALPIRTIGREVPGLTAFVAADVLGLAGASGLTMPLALQAIRLGPLLMCRIATRSILFDSGLRSAPSLGLFGVVLVERARAEERRDVIRTAGLPVVGDATKIVTRPAETALAKTVVPIRVPTALVVTPAALQGSPLALSFLREHNPLVGPRLHPLLVVNRCDVEAKNHRIAVSEKAPWAIRAGRAVAVACPVAAARTPAPLGGRVGQLGDGLFRAPQGVRISSLFLVDDREVRGTP